MEKELRTRLRSTASLSALLFSAKDITTVSAGDQRNSAALHRIVDALNAIRTSSEDIRFAYILRRTEDPMTLAFVADADTFAPPTALDSNGNGVVEENERGAMPGELYDINENPSLQHPAFVEPTVDPAFTHDQWGTFLSGYAPIVDASGTSVAVVGIDMEASTFVHLSQSVFSSFAFLLVLLIGVLIAGIFLWNSKKQRLAYSSIIADERSGILQLTLHRLGTPLTILKWSLEALVDCADAEACSIEDIRSHIEQLHKGITSMDEILRQLLTVERLEGGNLHIVPTPVSIKGSITSATSDLAPEWESRKQHIIVEDSCAITVVVDSELLRGVLHQVLLNAIVYSPHGSSIVIRATQKSGDIAVSVIDKGCGVKTGDRKRAFDKFTRGEGAHLYHPNGSGLGLYIARKTIEHIGGRIWMTNNRDKGTTVTFTIPKL